MYKQERNETAKCFAEIKRMTIFERLFQATSNTANSSRMKHLVLPEERIRPLPFYLAMEEWAARHLPGDDYFFTWIVAPTVIIGRHQELDCEVDLTYCREHDIAVCRRRSGGGAVFADRGNIMFSHITPDGNITRAFSRFTEMVARMLRDAGIPAETGGRNDVLVGGRKVSGNAFYRAHGRSIAHGTMLHTIDHARMRGALTPARAKLESHGVKSVESRVIGVSECSQLGIGELRSLAIRSLTDGEIRLSDADVCEIGRLAAHYSDPAWLRGARRLPVSRRTRLIEGLGSITASMDVHDGIVRAVSFTGDYLDPGGVVEAVAERLRGIPLAEIEGRIGETVTQSTVINPEELTALLTES